MYANGVTHTLSSAAQRHEHEHILTLSCPDAKGVVFRVASVLFEQGCNILDSAQFCDPETGLFFMRVHVECPASLSTDAFSNAFSGLAESDQMQWQFTPAHHKLKVLVLVSKSGHCLNDLLFRAANGKLAIEVVGVASNHRDFESLVSHHNLDFHHLPITDETKPQQEAALQALAKSTGAELIVLARYMQILSPKLCAAWSGKAINIHHSFLPSFKGAKPYAQAFARGVKIIGATSHYVTCDLDEGPIIEQDIERVDHTLDAEALSQIGADIESRVLARAVKWHAERRILLNGKKTVVFRS
jgi:formyltetrahydrofolate deformylase